MSKKTATLDMTTGSPLKLLILFAIPMLVGGVFQLFYNMVDTMVLGRFVSAEALAAVGATEATHSIFYHSNLALTNTVSILVSQAWGAKNDFRVKQTAAALLKSTLLCSIVMGLIGVLGAEPIMRFLVTPENIIHDSITYVRIVCGMNIAPLMYNSIASMLRAIGDSRTPLYFLILCSLLNVVLDLAAVLILDAGVAGVAWATVISQLVSVVLSLTYMWKKYPQLHFSREHFRRDPKLTRNYWAITTPMLIQYMSLSLGRLAINSVINSFGSDIVAAFTVGSKAESVTSVAFAQFTFAFSVYSGQNFGAKTYDRINRGFRTASTLVTSLAVASAAIVLAIAPQLASLFVETDSALLMTNAIQMIRIEALFMPALGMILLINSCLRGIGHIRPTFISSIVEMVSKVVISFSLSAVIGPTGIWLASPIGWVLGCIPGLWHYFRSGWKQKAIEADIKAAAAAE